MTTTKTETTKKDVATTIDIDEMKVVFEFGNKKKIEIKSTELDKSIVNMATLHGLKQKLGDAAAISRNPSTGKSASVADKYAAVLEVYERLTGDDPQWNKVREGGSPKYGQLLTALTQLYPDKNVDELKLYLDGKSKAEQNALRLNPKIAPIIEQLKLDKIGDIDTDSMLDELES